MNISVRETSAIVSHFQKWRIKVWKVKLLPHLITHRKSVTEPEVRDSSLNCTTIPTSSMNPFGFLRQNAQADLVDAKLK